MKKVIFTILIISITFSTALAELDIKVGLDIGAGWKDHNCNVRDWANTHRQL